MMSEIFVRLLIAHLLTDFILQPTSWVVDKKAKKGRSLWLLAHVVLTSVMAYLWLWDWSMWWVALVIGITHYIIDLYKIYYWGNELEGFLLDQLMHIGVLFFCAIAISGYDLSQLVESGNIELSHLYYICAFVFVTTPAGYLIGQATQTWRNEMSDNRDSLQKAGIWIGVIERLLVLTFVLLGEYEAIGFLIAAKSILRFGDKDGQNAGKQTEYVLIGTLMSFSVALFVGLLVMYSTGSI